MSGLNVDRLEELRARVDIAVVIGRRVQLKQSGRDLRGLCPFHGEKTPSFYVVPDKRMFHCFGCSKAGDAINFVMETEGKSFRDAVEQLANEFGVTLEADARTSTARRMAPKPPQPQRTPPPAAEVSALWAACRPLGLVPDVAESWAARGGIDLSHLEDRDLARALPLGTRCPRWARFNGHSWSEGPHRLLLRMFDAAGRMASLHARAVAGADPKGLSPAGCTLGGLVMADPLGLRLLAGDACGDGEPSAEAVRRVGLLICEGAPDFLTWGTHWSDADESAPAVFGIISGGWTADVAKRVPDDVRVLVATHADEAGEKYAATVSATLVQRCDVRRFRFPQEVVA